jgi:hypothetical protein
LGRFVPFFLITYAPTHYLHLGQAIISAVLVIVQMIVKGSRTIAAETNFGVCLADVQSGKWWVVWIPSMAFHTLVFGLLIWKSISTPREAQTLMLTLLIRDGIVYFVVVFAAFLFNLLVFAVAPVRRALNLECSLTDTVIR